MRTSSASIPSNLSTSDAQKALGVRLERLERENRRLDRQVQALSRAAEGLSGAHSMQSLAISALPVMASALDLSAAAIWVRNAEEPWQPLGVSRMGWEEAERIAEAAGETFPPGVDAFDPVRVADTPRGRAFACWFALLGGEAVLTLYARPDQEAIEILDDTFDTVAQAFGMAFSSAQALEEFERLASLDPLTGVANHRHLVQEIERTLESPHDEGVSVAMIDVDHFRRFNETYGHAVGDAALRHVANALRASVRSGDLVARYGGEEFTLLLPRAGSKAALQVAERCRTSLEATPFQVESAGAVRITASFGVAQLQRDDQTPTELLAAADRALYAAKHAGRNRVVLAE